MSQKQGHWTLDLADVIVLTFIQTHSSRPGVLHGNCQDLLAENGLPILIIPVVDLSPHRGSLLMLIRSESSSPASQILAPAVSDRAWIAG